MNINNIDIELQKIIIKKQMKAESNVEVIREFQMIEYQDQ